MNLVLGESKHPCIHLYIQRSDCPRDFRAVYTRCTWIGSKYPLYMDWQYIPVVHGLAVYTRCTWIGSIYTLYMDWQYIPVVHGLAVYTRCTWIGRVVAGHARLMEGSGCMVIFFPGIKK